jgi:hypothetical protein
MKDMLRILKCNMNIMGNHNDRNALFIKPLDKLI